MNLHFILLSPHIHLHLVFNVSLLKPYTLNFVPDRVVLAPSPIGLDDGL